MTVACTVAVVLGSPPEEEGRHRREKEARVLLARISEELWSYRHDHKKFPPGDGRGSSGLSRAMQEQTPGGTPYLSLGTNELTAAGDIINPATLQMTLVYYRNNRPAKEGEYAGHNPSSFDLWCHDAWGRPGGLNNWE